MSDMNDMLERVRRGDGFIAALDQSGGSTPKALAAYGVEESAYAGETEMFDRIHEMRTRIITSPAFDGRRVLGAILFEDTMGREIEGVGSARYLWDELGVVPFLKVDQGLAGEADGVQLMKHITGLDDLCERAVAAGVFGTKMRSVVKQANEQGIRAIVDQQFEVGAQILGHGLVPILEPEVDIHCPDKERAEELLRAAILEHLDRLDGDRVDDHEGDHEGDHGVMLKLTLPSVDGFYQPLVDHDRVLRVVALSGGYDRDRANELLARNPGVIASFSRALTEGLTAQMSDDEFDRALDEAIGSIYQASVA